ncbi:MAG: hypothetical protein AABW80_03545 [Nanoarchaeota archaeon]
MRKIILNHHVSTIIAKCGETGEFLFGKYDSSYPGLNKHLIGKVKLLGGNYFAGRNHDISPEETLRRELGEEFSGKVATEGEMATLQRHVFADEEEIRQVREALLNFEPFQDYFIHLPNQENNPQIYFVQSVYISFISKGIIKIVKDNLRRGHSLTNEGLIAVHSLKDIMERRPATFGITGLIIGQAERTSVPYCFQDALTFAPIGLPRRTYPMYLNNFEYKDYSKE